MFTTDEIVTFFPYKKPLREERLLEESKVLQNTQKKCFNNFVHSVENAGIEGDKNPNTSVVCLTLKKLAKKFLWPPDYARPVTKYLSDEKTHGAINSEMFNRLGYKNDQLYEVEIVKSEIERKEVNIVGVFILQYAKLRKL